MIDRRAVLRALGYGTVAAAAAAIAVYDVERLLWLPGERRVFLPPVAPLLPLDPYGQWLAANDTLQAFTITFRVGADGRWTAQSAR